MTDDTESREPDDDTPNRTGHGAAIFMAILLCYILSPVPLAWGLRKAGALDHLERPFYIFYSPLEYLADRIEFVGSFYQWQVQLFGL